MEILACAFGVHGTEIENCFIVQRFTELAMATEKYSTVASVSLHGQELLEACTNAILVL